MCVLYNSLSLTFLTLVTIHEKGTTSGKWHSRAWLHSENVWKKFLADFGQRARFILRTKVSTKALFRTCAKSEVIFKNLSNQGLINFDILTIWDFLYKFSCMLDFRIEQDFLWKVSSVFEQF